MNRRHPPTTPPTVPGILFSEVKNVVGDVVSISKKKHFRIYLNYCMMETELV